MQETFNFINVILFGQAVISHIYIERKYNKMQLELVWANEKPAVNLSDPIIVLEKVRNINHIILQANTANIVHCVSNQQYQSGRYQS